MAEIKREVHKRYPDIDAKEKGKAAVETPAPATAAIVPPPPAVDAGIQQALATAALLTPAKTTESGVDFFAKHFGCPKG